MAQREALTESLSHDAFQRAMSGLKIDDSLLEKRGRNAPKPVMIPGADPRLREINLLLTVETKAEGASAGTHFHNETINVLAEETIRNLKLRLRTRSFFTSKHCLVFGDRKLMENETVGQVADQCKRQEDSEFLHVFAKLSDVDALDVTTDRRSVGWNNGHSRTSHGPRSALTDSLSSNALIPQDRQLMLRGRVVEVGQALTEFVDRTEPVVHLVIRKSTRVHWHHQKGEKFEISISALDTVDTVKRKIEEVAEGLVGSSEYKVFHSGEVLDSGQPLASYGIGKGSILELVEEPLLLEEFPECAPKISSPSSPTHQLHDHWHKAKSALAEGVMPKLAPAGTGGSYFISSADGTKVAVFKPEDEEPQAPNNPKGYSGSPTGEGLRKGIRPGEGATREVIAYVLDHGHFASVPPTTMVSLSGKEQRQRPRHRKVGSFQQFVPHDMDCEEMGPSRFPVHEVHKICVLDIRLANTDRNGGNILARQKDGEWELTPIDHGYCLPDSFIDLNFEWMNWPQSKLPFTKMASEYINSLDADRDLLILSAHGLHLRRECQRILKVCTMLLKTCTARGLTPYQIGLIMCRQTLRRSPLEKMDKRATQLAVQEEYGNDTVGFASRLSVSDDVYMEKFSQVLEEYLEDFSEELVFL